MMRASTDGVVCTVVYALALSFAFKLSITSYCLEIVHAWTMHHKSLYQSENSFTSS